MNRFLNFILNYFNRPQQVSIELARITFGVCSLLIFQHKQLIISGKQVHESWNVDNYFPKGILTFLGESVPSINTIDVWMFLQFWSALFLIFGLFSRASLLINFLANLLLISLSESFSVGWSHGYNMNLLAQMPFIFAPVGRLFSVDYIIHKKIFKKETVECTNAMYLWMSNFGIVGIFFNAFFWKLITNRKYFSLEWAFSDNFRNHIISRYSFLGEDIPDYLQYLTNNEWAWQSTALLNLAFQALPFVSLLFLKKPKIRLLLGFLFVIEELGLMAVMQLYDYYWIPLVLLFVDWDYFLNRKFDEINNQQPFLSNRQKIIYSSYLIFTSYYIILAFQLSYCLTGKTVNSKDGINSYPFSSYSMYSTLLVKTEESSYKDLGFGFEIIDNRKFTYLLSKEKYEKSIQRKFYGYANLNDSVEVKNSANYLLSYLNESDKTKNFDSIALKRNIYEYNPYPKPAGVSVYQESYMALLLNDKFYYLYPKHKIKNDTVYIQPECCGFKPSKLKLSVYNFLHGKTFNWNYQQLKIPTKHLILEGGKVIFTLQTEEILNKPLNFSGIITIL